ncbi:Putative methyltransferase [Elusimicrobium minutum Pei191]|uniref:Putative methyltransferase n=1 Tax=Elusimicrobium minutum (strain Pei191) TaxID=445932 RepID=B2KBW3_ELUMP|nr:RsmD family RNA methyltransferase [Elusimicrobium minutum]ACC97867.1 Putative methyltransferase [Elusimicrobium minutum Pei191]
MRIIAGTAKGRKIFSVSKKMAVVPISDRIKQSVFDIIRPKIPACYFLDLFAGTGNVSLEALSRGAAKAVMLDKEVACVKNIKRNLEHLGFADRGMVFKGDVLKGIGFLSAYAPEGYDIIFMGPPYRDINEKPLSLSGPALAEAAKYNLLAKGGFIVLQHHKHEFFDVPALFKIYREEKYGDTLVHFLHFNKSKNPQPSKSEDFEGTIAKRKFVHANSDKQLKEIKQ